MKRLLEGSWIVLLVAVVFLLMTSCATAPPAKEEAKPAPAKKEAKKEPAKPAAPAPKKMTEADGVTEDGTLIRTNSPAFEMEYPTAFKMRPKSPGQIFNGASAAGTPTLEVLIEDLNEDGWEAHIQATIDGWKTALITAFGSKKVDIVRSEPTDRYEDFKAHEIEIEWLWTDGSTGLTSLVNLIEKEGKVIALSGTVMGDIDSLIGMFETIDLDP